MTRRNEDVIVIDREIKYLKSCKSRHECLKARQTVFRIVGFKLFIFNQVGFVFVQ